VLFIFSNLSFSSSPLLSPAGLLSSPIADILKLEPLEELPPENGEWAARLMLEG
jgi:hypothetical protein